MEEVVKYPKAFYNSWNDKIVLISEGRRYEGDVHFDDQKKEIRIYNFTKSELTDEEKSKILFELLKKTCMLPGCLNITVDDYYEVYTVLLNGYLLDGSFKETGKNYKKLIEEFVDDENFYSGDKEANHIKSKLKYLYNKYCDMIGKVEVELFLKTETIIKGVVEYFDMVRLLESYLLCKKGKIFKLLTSKKLLFKNKKIKFLPA